MTRNLNIRRKRARRCNAAGALSALARRLGVPRQRISEHRKAFAGEAPALSDVKGWKMLLATLEHGMTGPPDLRRKLAEKRLEFLSASAARERLRLAHDEDEMVSKTEVEMAIKKAVNAIFSVYDRFANVEMPPILKGCDEAQVRQQMVKAGKAIKATLLNEFGRFCDISNDKPVH